MTTAQVAVNLEARWTAEFEPAVVAPPASLVRGYDYDMAQVTSATAFNAEGLPEFAAEPTVVKNPAHRDRIVFDGVDVTYFRDRQTPTPAFQLIQPFAYGSATFTFPQISAVLESGSFPSWLKIGADVRVDRVNPATNNRVATDYRGVVIAINVDGAELSVEVGGELAGRAYLRDRQPPLFRHVVDIGTRVHDATVALGLRFEPFLGPTTGIKLPGGGGTTALDWLTKLCAMAVTKAGEHYTLMPRPGSPKIWEFTKKDTTTVDFTLYFDDARIVPSLKRDVSEEPNTYFGYGITSDGEKVKGDVYPGIEQGPTPAYPGPLTIGSTGDAVDAMIWRLINTVGLSRSDAEGGYDQDVADAIEGVQDTAGLTVTGDVDEPTWNAIYDLGVTGYSIRQARVMPLVQRTSVREWNYTATGVKTTRNADYDPSKLEVHKTMQFGQVESEQQMIRWCRRDMARNAGNNWTGTVKVNIAVIRGEHNPGDPAPSTSDVMPFREIRPGMNGWAPRFDGGKMLHVVAVNVDEGGKTGTLTLDTQYRDLLTVSEVIERNRDSRADPGRAFMNQHNRRSTADQDSMVTSSRKFGRLTGKVALTGATWNVFAVPAGQAGTVAWLHLKTIDVPTTFVAAVFGRYIQGGFLDGIIGDPFVLNADGESKWTDPIKRERIDEKLLLYAAGQGGQSLGYWPRKETKDNGEASGAPVTGEWRDDASFGFHTYAEPVLYVAVYPRDSCSVQRGRILGIQLEEGA